MRFRTVDANGDMMPIQNSEQLADGADAVGGAVDSRLAMLYGEWWEDETLGFRIPEFLFETVRYYETPLLERYITKYIAETPGVTGINGIITGLNEHQFTYACQILTSEGDVELEVASDGILRAVY